MAAWIDTLLNVNAELKARYASGLAWLDKAMKERGADGLRHARRRAADGVARLIAFKEPNGGARARASISSSWCAA